MQRFDAPLPVPAGSWRDFPSAWPLAFAAATCGSLVLHQHRCRRKDRYPFLCDSEPVFRNPRPSSARTAALLGSAKHPSAQRYHPATGSDQETGIVPPSSESLSCPKTSRPEMSWVRSKPGSPVASRIGQPSSNSRAVIDTPFHSQPSIAG